MYLFGTQIRLQYFNIKFIIISVYQIWAPNRYMAMDRWMFRMCKLFLERFLYFKIPMKIHNLTPVSIWFSYFNLYPDWGWDRWTWERHPWHRGGHQKQDQTNQEGRDQTWKQNIQAQCGTVPWCSSVWPGWWGQTVVRLQTRSGGETQTSTVSL